jgi:KDO2-lipid IV(A) lauroyltransferase
MLMLKRLRRLAAYLAVRSLVGLAAVLPRGIGRPVFGSLGRVAYLILRRSRRVTLTNLRLIYGGALAEREIRALAVSVFVNLGKFAYDVVRLGRGPSPGFKRIISVAGRQHLDAALAKGKGVIAVTGHVGNWELLSAYVSSTGCRVSVLATRMKDARLDDVVVGLRRQLGVVVLERSRGLREALRCLRRGEVLGVLIDQDTSVDSVVIDFLGRPAKTAVGPVKIAARTGAAIVPMAMLMAGDGRYRVEIREQIVIDGTEASLTKDVERCSKAVESFIRAEPSQWVWMHKRWKSVIADLYS